MDIEIGYKEQKEFLKAWNFERVKNMTLQEYTNNDRNDSFCYWIESKTLHTGEIRGATAYKFGIFRRANIETDIKSKTYSTDGEYSWSKKYGNTKEEAFSKIKSYIIKIVENSLNNNLHAINDIEIFSLFKWKIAFLYNPTKLIPIFKEESLKEIAQKLNISNSKSLKFSELQEGVIKTKKENMSTLEYGSYLWNKYPLKELNNKESKEKTKVANKEEIIYPLNQILYGPPGTGKTYNTINYALSIITGQTLENLNDKCKTKEGREKIIEEYNKYLEANQIKFITFHQSFSYEDFIEGIKPVIDKENNEELENNPEIDKTNIAYELKDGIFKSIADSALKYKEFLKNNNQKLSIDINDKTEFYKVSLGDSQVEEEINTYEHCRDNGVISIGWGNNVNFTGVKNTEDIKERFDNIIDDEKLKNQYAVSAVKNFVINMKKGDIIFVSKGNSLLRAVGIVDGNYEFKENSPIDYHQFRKVKWVLQDIELPVNKIYGKKFSQQTIYKLDKKLILHDIFQEQNENSTLSDKYVLIIDEINRGNVSNIFGELITLIETDKRHGKTESLTVELPYSNNKFSVPDNLYIIGTMNTADRSVEALDTALRRRFSFIEMHPKPELLKNIGGEINLEKLLQTINDRLEILLDKDHTIGHSYFFNVDKNNPEKSLREIFQNSIIPLLQEYFYGDWGKIGLVLGESFIKKKDVKTGFAKNFKYEDSDELIKDIFEFKPSNEWNFKSIYE